ncbi:hypothetical protein Bsp3421_002087 [Burkholderia sp. FERM BP-3421]|uniref:hypothetical protein n=1 Tax=Burkholderia sp. FERM BP-3421 TaxID=1494466 RepID=UPI00235F216E|nr:hypothetical protein [Burkholderia sp. FERM BP-3421]WDD92104.1 hypothetical protein Bsp3421_002087 [Burkholderia sp. FERM BP-3421]
MPGFPGPARACSPPVRSVDDAGGDPGSGLCAVGFETRDEARSIPTRAGLFERGTITCRRKVPATGECHL